MPKIKLYREEGSNEFSGNALVTYLLRPSVELALTVLDGAKFEVGRRGGESDRGRF